MGKYISKNLGIGEQAVLLGEIHWAVLLPNIIIAVLFSVAECIFCDDTAISIFLVVLTIFIMWLITLPKIVKIRTTEIGFTNKNFIGKTGWINVKVMNSPLNKVNNVSVQSGFFGTLFGYGTIHVNSASGNYIFRYIKNADFFRTNLLQTIENYETEKVKQSAKEMAAAMLWKR